MNLYSVARRALRPASTLLAVLAFSNCSTDTLDITDPDIIAPVDLATPVGVTAMRNGAVQDFTVVFSGTIDGFIVQTGNMADEFITTDTFFDRLLVNERNMNDNLGGAADAFFLNLHQARVGLTRTIKIWAELKPTSKDTLSEMYSLRGFVENFFGETYCSGVPFSEEDGSTQTYGEPQTTAQVYARALASLDSGLTNAVGASYQNLARVGRGRVLLNQGQFAAAAAAVASVPTNFRYQTFHSNATAAQRNALWSLRNASPRYSITTNEGTNGLNFLTTPADPRVPWTTSTRSGFDGTTLNLPTQGKYPEPTSSATLADGIEARLIELEAKLQANTQAARDEVFAGLNNLRTTAITPAMTAMTGTAPTTQAAAVDQLFSERAKWLWLTGHRLGDMRRLIRQYGRPANTVFPVGPVITRSGSVYGNDVNFIIPFNETNNPKFKGCIDRNA
jgi:hypothetical protein